MGSSALSLPSYGLVVSGGTGTENPTVNTVAPVDNPFWDNVGWGSFGTSPGNPGSAVYLGNGLVLTANHTSSGRIILGTDDASGGTGHSAAIGGINQNLLNPDDSESELRVFEIASDPGLPTIPIYDQPITVGTSLMMVGTGFARASAEQTYDFAGSTPGIDGTGYDWTNARDKTWGNNTVSNSTTFFNNISGLNNFYGFKAEFDDVDGEAMATAFDSGSAVFAFDETEDRWELAGIATAITLEVAQAAGANGSVRQNDDSSLYGQETIFIDVTRYADQINALLPEPTTLGLIAAMAPLTLRRRRQR